VSGYRIADEPRPSALSKVAVNPVWPLFAIMLAGTWLSWSWFVLNGFALGSPSRWREVALAVLGVFGSLAIVLGLGVFLGLGWIQESWLPYAFTVLLVWKIGVSYGLHIQQGRTFELYRYYGGTVEGRLPFVVLAAGYFLRPQFLGALPGFWRQVFF
jgi:hypothetical protein